MHSFFYKYIISWVSFCILALGIFFTNREALIPEVKTYVSFLNVQWKILIFIPAFVFVTFAGRFTDDETWDVISGGGMSIFTFLTAAWSVGTIYKVFQGERPPSYLIISLALCLFSSSWFYDGYLLLRDGAYTHRWLGNLTLSPIIYLCAGLLWNLENAQGQWFKFSFTRADWPTPPLDPGFGSLLWVSIPLVLIAAYVLVGFVGWKFNFSETPPYSFKHTAFISFIGTLTPVILVTLVWKFFDINFTWANFFWSSAGSYPVMIVACYLGNAEMTRRYPEFYRDIGDNPGQIINLMFGFFLSHSYLIILLMLFLLLRDIRKIV